MFAVKKLQLALCISAAFAAGSALAGGLAPVPAANPKITGLASPNILSPQLIETVVAQGSMPLENSADGLPFYGYANDGPMLPAPGDVQASGHNVEATKTEPDKNVYLVMSGQTGADAAYNYGKHFLYQVHESGPKDPATGVKIGDLTRINLDADGAHRITQLATRDSLGNPLPACDGITWNPFAQKLLLTAELGSKGGVWQATATYPSVAQDISGAMGRGGYEGIQNDSAGNAWIVEDVGGKSGSTTPNAKQPNSFVYRFVPYDKADLTKGGKLQALQVMSIANPGQPIIFHGSPADPDVDILSQDMKDLHTYGNVFATNWITLHDTSVNGNTPFDANALAKAKLATPFKRPENGQFRPGSRFREFYFDETGDTNLLTEAADYGGFGAVMKISQSSPSADTGTLTLFYKGDAGHSGFDNVAFWDANKIVFVEDAGDTLHSQRNALDSGFMLDVRTNYADGTAPTRILALGRDASATIDSGIGAISGNGFQNDGDNEITGIHISNGDPSVNGLLGAKIPQPFKQGWRMFYTQQHGDNTTFEVLPGKSSKSDQDNDRD